MRTFTTSSILLISLVAVAGAQTATPTSHMSIVRRGECYALTDETATFIGDRTDRSDLIYWAETGPCFCGYPNSTPIPDKTPGAGWNKLNTGTGVHLCSYEDQPLACFGSGCILCIDEGRKVTSTPTPSATPTDTP